MSGSGVEEVLKLVACLGGVNECVEARSGTVNFAPDRVT